MSVFSEKVVVITGAATGIGRATAMAFANEGAHVMLSDINEAAGEALAAELRHNGARTSFIRCDVAEAADCESLVSSTLREYGRLDFAFNNAGISEGQLQSHPIADYPLEQWKKVIDINLSGVFYCLRQEIPAMLANGGGAIVNTASVAGQIAFANVAGYVASKHAVMGLSKAAAVEYGAQGIRCNTIDPGFIDTQMLPPAAHEWMRSVTPSGRIGTVDEVAKAVLWLCSPNASFINGTCLNVDGGFLCQ